MTTIRDPDDRLARLFELHAPRLRAYARRHTDAAEADDLVADAFVTALRRPDTLPVVDEDVWPWLVGVVRRLAANQRRRRTTRDGHSGSWPASQRAALWDGLSDRAAQPAGDGRRPHGAVAAATAALAAVLAFVTMLSGASASAREELHRLALSAAQADGPAIRPGTYLHVRTESLQHDSSLFGDGRTLDTDREAWIRWDGATWAIDTRPSAGWTEYQRFPTPRAADYASPTPAFVAALPRDARALHARLDRTVSGSHSHDEALFVAIDDLVHSRMLDPQHLSVALEVLADVHGVRTRDVLVDGRSAVEVRFNRFGLGLLGRDAFTVDRETGQVISETDSDPGGTYRSRTTLVDVVSGIPAHVEQSFRRHADERVCANGQPASGDGECP